MYIAIEGVIGVGKTTLARLLQPAFQAALLLEVFEENPFLSDFYADRERYAFQTQIFFLLSRYHQQRRAVGDLLAEQDSLFSDYTFEKDALFARINLAGDELEMYIAFRDRPYERNMEQDYIHQLNLAYEEFFGDHHQEAMVLQIETDDLDYVRNPEALKFVENRIRQTLRLPPFQQELPLGSGAQQ
jgi:deoxyguanosine kinase